MSGHHDFTQNDFQASANMDTIDGTNNKKHDETQNIEESIIEEDITMPENQSPTTPLITSKTKGKGKLNLFQMKPPKPFKQNSGIFEKRGSVNESTIQEEISSAQFYQKPKETEKVGGFREQSAEVIRQGGTNLIMDETYDEMY